MKKLIGLLILSLSLCGTALAVTYDEGTFANTKDDHPGSAADPVRVYQLVRFGLYGNSTQPVSNGDVLIWDLVSDDGVTVGRVGASTAVSVDAVAGVAVGVIATADNQSSSAANDLGRRNWGFIQVYGLHTAVQVDASSITLGNALEASATASKAGVANCTVGSTCAGAFGFAYDTSSATGTAEVFIRAR